MVEVSPLMQAEAVSALEGGCPQQALMIWRELLLDERASVLAHLHAAQSALPKDPIASVRRDGLRLANALLQTEPGASEVSLLGRLLRGWGEICFLEVPSRALQFFERAWVCGRDQRLDAFLAGLYARKGFGQGAWALSAPPAVIDPWPVQTSLDQARELCQQHPLPVESEGALTLVPEGRIWLQRHTNPWGITHGIAVQDRHGEFRLDFCRSYPWACPRLLKHQEFAVQQLKLAQATLPPAERIRGPVLAVAEMSAELYYHWQLELLPRLGRIWSKALARWPDLRLWHNGGSSPWVQQCLERLGIGPERVLAASSHLQAETLLVPAVNDHFGSPSSAAMDWLENFWSLQGPEQQSPPATGTACWLGREGAVRRPVLAEGLWLDQLKGMGLKPLTQGSIVEQMAQVSSAGIVLAPHGAGMANLMAAVPGSKVYEFVNPGYQPEYFTSLFERQALHHQRFDAAVTPVPLQEWLYEGPISFPIDLRPGCSEAAEVLSRLSP